MFPKSISVSAFLTNDMEVASSGKLVPIARMVKPINSSGMPAKVARFFATKTRQSEPIHNARVASRMTSDENASEFELSPPFDSNPCSIMLEFLFLRALEVIQKR